MGYYMAGGYYRAGQWGQVAQSLVGDVAGQMIGTYLKQKYLAPSTPVASHVTDYSPEQMASHTVSSGHTGGPGGNVGAGELALGGHRAHRRMNPFNPRALRRADRRLHSFLKHVRKYVTLAHHGAHGVKLKHHRRRSR